MKSVPTALRDAIRKDYNLYAKPRLIADWNMNRYGNPTADNVPAEVDEGQDVEMFPIESIIQSPRPTKGICKARVGEGVINDEYGMRANTAARTSSARYYMAQPDDVYQYWSAPVRSDSAGNITKCEPFVLYASNVKVNKIVAKLENSWASPANFTVQITTDGTTWTTVATNPTIRSDGQVVLYYNGTGWSATRPADVTALKTLRGIKLKVTSLGPGIDGNGNISTYKTKSQANWGNDTDGVYSTVRTTGANSNFNLIALEAHMEADLTSRLTSVNDTFDMSEVSELYPVGTLTANVAELSLSNVDGIFNNENPDSPYFNLLEPNVEFNLEYVYTVGTTPYSVQQFKMYADDAWTGQSDETVSVSLVDASKYLQETTPPAAMWENLTVPQIVWRLMDSVGFVDYVIDADDRVAEHTVPVFWVTGEQSVWEVLDDLAKGTQTAIYFDSFGDMQVRTRTAAFDDLKAPAWTLRGEKAGDEPADIAEWNQAEQVEANHVTVSYTTTNWSEWNNGQPALTKVWEPDSDIVALRAADLQRTLEIDGQWFWIPAADVVYWLYKGQVNIQGELIAYDGKHYVYYTYTVTEVPHTWPDGTTTKSLVYSNETRHEAWLHSEDERTKIDAGTPDAYRYKNHFSGALYITERGLWNSEAKQHPVDAAGYFVRNITASGHHNNVSGFKHNKGDSTVTLANHPNANRPGDLLIATRGATSDTGFYIYGTMFRFEAEGSRTTQRAGMVINSQGGNNEDGYYIDFVPSRTLDGKDRKVRNELMLYARSGGHDVRVGGTGHAVAIAEGIWYELDVYFNPSNHSITVYLNGRNVLSEVVPVPNRVTWNGRFGMFLRGKTKVTYEYLAAIARAEDQPEDDVTWFDMVAGGYRGDQWGREYTYGWRTRKRRVKKKWKTEAYRYSMMFFDEFGPIVHEIREFNVKFDPKPILHSKLYMTNDWNAIITEYRANPFGAHFIIANTGRQNSVIHGEDTIHYASESRATNQTLTVLGRALVISEAEKVIVKNDQAIQRRGKVETELASSWIQSKEMAEDIANWMKDHWGMGADTAEVTVFGNPLLEVGDVVTVSYVRYDMTPATHKYFITGASSSFDTGLSTTLHLRRVV